MSNLVISDLYVDVLTEEGPKQILKGVDLTVNSGKDDRSEERRVGKECRSRWSPYH